MGTKKGPKARDPVDALGRWFDKFGSEMEETCEALWDELTDRIRDQVDAAFPRPEEDLAVKEEAPGGEDIVMGTEVEEDSSQNWRPSPFATRGARA